MKPICGVIRFDAPVSPNDLEAMAAAMPYASRGGSWIGEGAGLAQLGGEGPLVHGDCVIVASARLDNEDELRREVGGDSGMSDLIARAYERWGEDTPRHLLGDWSFAAWHPRERRLFLARDQFGGAAMLYYTDERMFAFAPSSKALFALPDVPRRLNELRISQLLSLWTIDGAATAHESVRRLRPTELAVVAGRHVELRHHWSLEDAPALQFASDEEYVEQFVELFAKAVRTRVRSTAPIGSQLSAGLDSGAVTALAARELQGRGERLTAFTSVPLFGAEAVAELGPSADEWSLAQRTAAWTGNVDHIAIVAEGMTPLRAVNRFLDEHGEPEVASPNHIWNMAMLDEAQRRGIRTLLTGQNGNVGVSWPGYPAPAFRAAARGHLREAWRMMAGWRARHGLSWPRTAWHTLVKPAQVAVKRSIARVRMPAFDPGPFINPAFAKRLDLATRARDAGWLAKFATASPEELRFGVVAPGVTPGNPFYEVLERSGVEMLDPTADLRLLQFCARLPERLFVRPDADRWLVRRGMEGILPPEVQWNVRRGLQSADLAYRLRADAANVDAAVARIAASPRANEYLNVAHLRESWRTIGNPAERRPTIAALSFVPLLMVGEFLARLDDEDGSNGLSR